MKLFKNVLYLACLVCWAIVVLGATCILRAGFVAAGIIVLMAGLIQIGIVTLAVIKP